MSRINWNKWELTVSPIHDWVFIAHIKRRSPDGSMIEADDKKEVTSQFYAIMVELLKRNDNELILDVNGKPKYRIILEELGEEASP